MKSLVVNDHLSEVTAAAESDLFVAYTGYILLLREYKKLIVITKLNYGNLEIACSKFSFIKYIFWYLYSEESPCGSILVSDHLP